MDTSSLVVPLRADRQIRVTSCEVDTFTGEICVVRCIHKQDGKAWIQDEQENAYKPTEQARS